MRLLTLCFVVEAVRASGFTRMLAQEMVNQFSFLKIFKNSDKGRKKPINSESVSELIKSILN